MTTPVPCPTYESVIESKQLTDAELIKALKTLKRFKADEPARCFAGNPVLYHFMLDALCHVRLKNGSFRDLMYSEELRNDMWAKANQYANGSRENNLPLRLFEMWRRMNGAIVFFKPATAMYVYKKYKATSVLDPCAGWGGRMLGAWALNINYIGFDTNEMLRAPYTKMVPLLMKEKAESKLGMVWDSSLEADFTMYDYDFVLTSPPYLNLELYPGMTPFEGKEQFYKNFLIPLIDKCRKHIKAGGRVAFNISPPMYRDLTEVFKYEKAAEAVPLLQQKVQGRDKGDMIYVW
jgi:hypothetical protein